MSFRCSDLVNIVLLIGVLGVGCGGGALTTPRTMYSLQEATSDRASAANLVLSGQSLTRVPDEVASLKALRGLDLSHNKLTTLPEFLSSLPGLELLDLRSNAFTELPPGLKSLSLKRLYLDDNQLSDLENLPPDLEELYVSHNHLKALGELGPMKHLRLLHLAANQLDALPDSLGRYTQLEELNVSDNKLTTLPASLSQLDRLQTLIARNNQIVEPGFDPGRNDRLLLVSLEGNPIAPATQKALKKAQPRATWRFSLPVPEEDSP